MNRTATTLEVRFVSLVLSWRASSCGDGRCQLTSAVDFLDFQRE
jgi:hypothetical protein